MVMPTGFGKTAVEWMAMAEFQDGSEKIVLIAPTTGLVDQQRSMAVQHLNIEEHRIVTYTGDTGHDKTAGTWEQATVVMATPQVIRNDAMSGIIDLSDVDLLIMDEAHHATGNHAYAQVGTLYQRTNPRGRVLAATASPSSSLRNINEVRTNLNAHNLDLCKRTDPLLDAYDVDMDIHTHTVDLPETLLALISPLQMHFKDEVAHLQRLGFMPTKEYIGTNDIERAQQSASRAIQQRCSGLRRRKACGRLAPNSHPDQPDANTRNQGGSGLFEQGGRRRKVGAKNQSHAGPSCGSPTPISAQRRGGTPSEILHR